MKKIILMILVCIVSNTKVEAQELMSTYNLSKNDLNSMQLYEDEYKSQRFKEPNNRKNRFAKTMMYTGLLVGGLVIGQQAVKHEYYMNNTTIYGIGGVMTILATGLVLTSVNGINKNLFVAYTGNGLKISMTI
jgi:hypothetical protein